MQDYNGNESNTENKTCIASNINDYNFKEKKNLLPISFNQ